MIVIKRNGTQVLFNDKKIFDAIKKSVNDIPQRDKPHYNQDDIAAITQKITAKIFQLYSFGSVTVEEIQDVVQRTLVQESWAVVAISYIRYRYEHEIARKKNTIDDSILSLVQYENEEIKQENSNKNPQILPTQRDYIAGVVGRDFAERMIFSKKLWEAHENGLIHIHDTDYSPLLRMSNCCVFNLDDMLQNGTVISGTKIDKPHLFSTACNITLQIVAQVASSQYGGTTFTLSHLAPFVDETRQKFRRDYAQLRNSLSEQAFSTFIEKLVREDIRRGVQTIQYQVITLMTTNGQAPFLSIFMYLDEVPAGRARDDLAMVIEEVLLQRYQGVKNEQGVWISPAFPKLLYCLDDDNAYDGTSYFYLTKLAAKCTAKRMVPDYISAKKMKELKGDVYPCMGCRSFLTPDRFTKAGVGNIANALNYKQNVNKYYGRWNQGVVTINLADVGLSANKDFDKFWQLMEERLELCHEALMIRHKRLRGTKSDVAPILWQHGAFARLNKGQVIDPLLYNGYSTISLGYAGLYECVKAMTGYSHTDDEAKDFALQIMQSLNDHCQKWKHEENIDYSVYGTPIESTTYKFAKCLKNRFGIIDGITNKNWITNSYHVTPTEHINAFTKLAFESEFQALSPGGAISYIEVPNMQDNIQAIIQIMQYMYENIMYAEINTKSDYCQVCGWDGQIETIEENGKYIWECPRCKNRDQHKLNVCRRTCGYIGTNFWNQGRTEEIRQRVLHI